jgi:hypothetical protein
MGAVLTQKAYDPTELEFAGAGIVDARWRRLIATATDEKKNRKKEGQTERKTRSREARKRFGVGAQKFSESFEWMHGASFQFIERAIIGASPKEPSRRVRVYSRRAAWNAAHRSPDAT